MHAHSAAVCVCVCSPTIRYARARGGAHCAQMLEIGTSGTHRRPRFRERAGRSETAKPKVEDFLATAQLLHHAIGPTRAPRSGEAQGKNVTISSGSSGASCAHGGVASRTSGRIPAVLHTDRAHVTRFGAFSLSRVGLRSHMRPLPWRSLERVAAAKKQHRQRTEAVETGAFVRLLRLGHYRLLRPRLARVEAPHLEHVRRRGVGRLRREPRRMRGRLRRRLSRVVARSSDVAVSARDRQAKLRAAFKPKLGTSIGGRATR